MTRDDIVRMESEILSWRELYYALVKAMADSAAMPPPRLLAEKESYELGRLHGAVAEREACAQVCDQYAERRWDTAVAEKCAAAIRARGQG